MKSKIFTALFFLSTSAFAFNSKATYKVTLTNLTKGQPITPLIISTSESHSSFFQLGQPASKGLLGLAEDGKTDVLKKEIQMKMSTQHIVTGKTLTFPGKSASLEIKGRKKSYLSLAAMLAKTNDAFIAAQNISLNLKEGESKMVKLHVYDSGTEENNELSSFIPAFGSSNVRTDKSEGFVHPHIGITGNGDLNPATDGFAPIAAIIKIKRIK